MSVSISLSVCLLLCMQGFGFVTFASSASAESARLAMNGAVVEGRKIEVQQQFHVLTYSVDCRAVLLWSPYVIGQTIYIFLLWFVLLLFFSSFNLSRRRLDVCHTSTHGVALVRI